LNSPFDKEKYEELLNGLEISEIRLKDILNTKTYRLDSDYFLKKYIKLDSFVKKNSDKFFNLSSRGLKVDASAFYPALEPFYDTGDIPFIRVADVGEQIDYNRCVKIPKMGSEFNTLKMAKKGDVVITKGGRIGTTGLITKDSYLTRDLIFINSS
jgi:hypothetical protein